MLMSKPVVNSLKWKTGILTVDEQGAFVERTATSAEPQGQSLLCKSHVGYG